jgi:GH24 family phage-related lysozyme (muramidase)
MQPLPDAGLPWPLPLDAVRLIAESEGLRLAAYLCPAGVWTIGWGETDGVQPGDTCTKEQADRWLCEDLTDRAKAVRELCTSAPSRNELGALVSLSFVWLAARGVDWPAAWATLVAADRMAKFQQAMIVIMKANMDALKKKEKTRKAA